MKHALLLLLAAVAAQAALLPAGRRGGDGVLCSLEENGSLLRGCGCWLEAWSGIEGEPVLEVRLDLEEPVIDLARLSEGPVVALTRDGTLVGYDWSGAAPEELWRLDADDMECAQRLEPWSGGLLIVGEGQFSELRDNGAVPDLRTIPELWGHDACVLGDTLLVDMSYRCFPSWDVVFEWASYAWDGDAWTQLSDGTLYDHGLLGDVQMLEASASDGQRLALWGEGISVVGRGGFATPRSGWVAGVGSDWRHGAVALVGDRLLIGGEGLGLAALAGWQGGELGLIDTMPLSAVDAIHVSGTVARVDHAAGTDWLSFDGNVFTTLRSLPSVGPADEIAFGASLAAFFRADGVLELDRFVDDRLETAWSGALRYDGVPTWDGDRLLFVDTVSESVGWLGCSDPADPLPLGESGFPGLIAAKSWNDRLAVLRADGVVVYDATDPQTPLSLLQEPLAGCTALEGEGPTFGIMQSDGTLRALQLDADPPWLGDPLPEAMEEGTRVVTLRDRLLTLRNEQRSGNWGVVAVAVWNAGSSEPLPLSSMEIDSRRLLAAGVDANRLLLHLDGWYPIWDPDTFLGAWWLDDTGQLQRLAETRLAFDHEDARFGGGRAAFHRPDRGWTLYREDSDVAVEVPPYRPTALLAASPNPFNPSCTIEFMLELPGEVELVVHNLLGQRVATLVSGRQHAGSHRRSFDGSALPSGIYFARLDAGGESRIVKLTLLR